MKFARIIAFIAAAHVMGGHWLILQMVAWSGMLISFSQQDGFATAVEKTFDGSSPCCICEMVQQGQEEEQDQSIVESNLKLDAVLAGSVKVPRRASFQFTYSPWNAQLLSARDLGPAPPPPDCA